jgi:hypothetical protein
MRSATDRLVFAVRFMQTKLEELSATARAALKDELEAFLQHAPLFVRTHKEVAIARTATGGIIPRVIGGPKVKDWTGDAVRELQEEVRALFNYIIESRAFQAGDPRYKEPIEAGRKEDGGLTAISGLDLPIFWPSVGYSPLPVLNAFHVLWATGNAHDLFLLVLNFIITQEPTDKILRCPECKNVFVRIRRQQYCSRTCTKRAVMRNWRKTPAGKAAQARSSKLQYAKTKQRRKKLVRRVEKIAAA